MFVFEKNLFDTLGTGPDPDWEQFLVKHPDCSQQRLAKDFTILFYFWADNFCYMIKYFSTATQQIFKLKISNFLG